MGESCYWFALIPRELDKRFIGQLVDALRAACAATFSEKMPTHVLHVSGVDGLEGYSMHEVCEEAVGEKCHLRCMFEIVSTAYADLDKKKLSAPVYFIGVPGYGGRLYVISLEKDRCRAWVVPFDRLAEAVDAIGVSPEKYCQDVAIATYYAVIEIDGKRVYVCKLCKGSRVFHTTDWREAVEHLRECHGFAHALPEP